MKIVSAVMAFVFLLSVAVQYNDPDGSAWMVLYGAAALLSMAVIFDRKVGVASGLLGLVSIVWALVLLLRLGPVSAGEVLTGFGMASTTAEQAREVGGLLIVALWMAAILIRDVRRSRLTEARIR